MRAIVALSSLTILLAATGCTSTGKYVRGQAYESCKGRTGDAFERCIAAEEDRIALELKERNESCLAEIEEQRDRRAMIEGRRAGNSETEAATGC